MTTIDQTAFAQLEAEERLINPVLKEKTHKPGRFGFRGTLAVKLAISQAGEKRPPDLAVDQVQAVAHAGEPHIAFFAAFLLSFEEIVPLAELLAGKVGPEGVYILFVDNYPKKAKVKIGDATWHILPIDEAMVHAELLDLLKVDKNDLKKLDTAGKLDFFADTAFKSFDGSKWEEITVEQGLERMGPVRDKNEGRPV